MSNLKENQQPPANADGSFNQPVSRETVLKDPVNHNLIDIFKELKFGRPVKSQLYLQKCIEELSTGLPINEIPPMGCPDLTPNDFCDEEEWAKYLKKD